jgi:hypothetical protein
MLADWTDLEFASRMSAEYEMVLMFLLEKSEGMTKTPMKNATRAIVMIRRRIWGAMGCSPPGRYFFIPFGLF